MKKRLGLVLLCIGMISAQLLSGCSQTATTTAQSSQTTKTEVTSATTATTEKTYKIAISTFSEAIPWQIQTLAVAKEAATALGSKVDFSIFNCNLKVADQITQIENLINQKYDAILVDASSATGLNPTLQKAKDAGIVIISYNCIVDDPSVVTSRVFVDQKEWGAVMAQWLCDKLNGKGNIVFFEGLSGNQISADRTAGAEEVFAKYPDIKILAKGAGEWDQATSEALMQTWVTSFPKIDGAWCSGSASSIATVNVLKKNNMALIPTTAEAQNAWIKMWHDNLSNGLSSIAPVCPPYIAQVALNAALQALSGTTLPQDLKLVMPILQDDTVNTKYVADAPDEYFAFDKISQADIDKLFK